jgi:hypothetical protein
MVGDQSVPGEDDHRHHPDRPTDQLEPGADNLLRDPSGVCHVPRLDGDSTEGSAPAATDA